MPGPWRAGIVALVVAAGVPAGADVPVVELDGVVHAITAAHVVQAIEDADVAGAPLLVIRLDTPGGLDTSMRQIIDRMLNCKTPVAVFVGPSGARAASAGFVITISADVAAMAVGTNIGAAHPVSGLGQMDEVLSSKTIWTCASCLQCASRCPKGVEFSNICDALRAVVLRTRLATPKVDADEVTSVMVSDAPQLGVVGALRKLSG